MLLGLDGVAPGRSYGFPSFLLKGKFFARFRDDDTVLALRLGSIDDRAVLMQIDPRAFFFTEHYRDYPSVLIRLSEVKREVLADVLTSAWRTLTSARRRPSGAARRARR